MKLAEAIDFHVIEEAVDNTKFIEKLVYPIGTKRSQAYG